MTLRIRCVALATLVVVVGFGLPGCGSESASPGIGRITLTAINFDGTIGDGCTVGAPGPFPTTPTEFAISGENFATVPNSEVVVRFTSVDDDVLPFHIGTAATQAVVGEVVSDTLICGKTPPVFICNGETVEVTVQVVLASLVRDDSTPESLGPVFTLEFSAPVITDIEPACVGSLISAPLTINGMFFGDDDDEVTVRFTSNENLPDGDPIFADGTVNTIDVIGVVSGGGTVITASTPKATNQVEDLEEDPPGASTNPLHRVSDPLEDAAVSIILGNGSCTSREDAPEIVQFNRPEGDTILGDYPPSMPPAIATSIRQTVATPFVITGTLDAECPDPFAPIGGTVQITFSAPGDPSVPADAFQLDASGGGTQDFDVVDAEIISGTEIRGVTPIVRAREDFVPVVRIHFEDGTISPVLQAFTWEAPPVIDGVLNLDAGTGNGFLLSLADTEFVGCNSSSIEITGINFTTPFTGEADEDPVVQMYDQDTGTSRSLGTNNPDAASATPAGNELGDPFTASDSEITGETRIEGLLAELDDDGDGEVAVVVRVVAADGQYGEFVIPDFTSQPPFNVSSDADATNNNTSVAIDPTSVADDFAPAAPDGDAEFGMNICVVTGADVLFQPPPPLFPFAADEVFVSYSIDGGVSWDETVIDDGVDGFEEDAFRNFAMAGYDAFGSLFVSYLVDDLETLSSNVVIAMSTDKGATWTDVTPVGVGLQEDAANDPYLFGTLDRPALAVGNATDPVVSDDQAVCVSFIDVLGLAVVAGPESQVLASGLKTTGFGATAALLGPLPALVNDGFAGDVFLLQHARCAIGTEGELYVVWHDLDAPFPAPAPPTPPATWSLLMDVDVDGLDSAVFDFGGDSLVDVISVPGTTRLSSPDFGPPLPHTDICVIQAGTHAGRCIVAYEDVEPGEGGPDDVTAVITRATDDFGFSFLGREVVHPVTPNDHYLPALASDPVTGRVYVTWNDTTLDSDDELVDRFSAASDDGRTWSAALRLSTLSSTAPADDGEFSDYGIQSGVAAYGGCVVAVWAESEDEDTRKEAMVRIYQQKAATTP